METTRKLNKHKFLQCATLHRVLRNEMTGTAWRLPTVGDSIRFMAGEAYEAMDAEMRARTTYARNNDKGADLSQVGVELADVMMMGLSALIAMGPETERHAVSRVVEIPFEIVEVDGMYTDAVYVKSAKALGNYVDYARNSDGDAAYHGWGSVVDTVGLAYATSAHLGFDPLTFLKNKLVAQAVKHGERHEEGFGIRIADMLNNYYETFVGEG